jgi:hypothetical protein
MNDFLQSNSLYIVLLIALINWGGIFLFVTRLFKKVNHLEHTLFGHRD